MILIGKKDGSRWYLCPWSGRCIKLPGASAPAQPRGEK
jgi:hypothetical protein